MSRSAVWRGRQSMGGSGRRSKEGAEPPKKRGDAERKDDVERQAEGEPGERPRPPVKRDRGGSGSVPILD